MALRAHQGDGTSLLWHTLQQTGEQITRGFRGVTYHNVKKETSLSLERSTDVNVLLRPQFLSQNIRVKSLTIK